VLCLDQALIQLISNNELFIRLRLVLDLFTKYWSGGTLARRQNLTLTSFEAPAEERYQIRRSISMEFNSCWLSSTDCESDGEARIYTVRAKGPGQVLQ